MPHSVSPTASPKPDTERQERAGSSESGPTGNNYNNSQTGNEAAEEADGANASSGSGDSPDAKDSAGQATTDKPAITLEQDKVKLEDMFDDDDDEEFPSSAPAVDVKMTDIDAPSSMPGPKYSDPEIMYAFYQRLFPFRTLFQWLNHSPTPSNDFGHREFAFTLQNDAYLRYQAFPTADLLRKEILRLNPSRFEIGPVYTTNPRERKTLRKASAFRPLAKELVFDIDLTDYDEIRTCCDKANICHKCWSFITMAIKVVDAALRDDFGFKHIMWVYSGRRGAHAWICDRRAREMDDQKRKAIAGYLELIRGGAQTNKKVNVRRPLHPHIARSLEILKPHFQTDILTDQDPWQTDARFAALLKLLPDNSLNESLRKKWESAPNRPSTSKWADIDTLAKTGASRSLDSKALLEAKQDIVLEYTYPRLDVEVSKKLIHLLKSPFVVHPGTGRVCVPIDTRRLEEFDPLDVPTVTQLLDEIDAWDRKHGSAGLNPSQGGENSGAGASQEGAEQEDSQRQASQEEAQQRRLQDYEKTSLKPYVDYFRAFVANLLKDEKSLKRERNEAGGSGDAMEF